MPDLPPDLERALAEIHRGEGGSRPAPLPEAYLRALEEIERLPCNRPGEDKSWVLRAAENRRRFFRSMQRASGG